MTRCLLVLGLIFAVSPAFADQGAQRITPGRSLSLQGDLLDLNTPICSPAAGSYSVAYRNSIATGCTTRKSDDFATLLFTGSSPATYTMPQSKVTTFTGSISGTTLTTPANAVIIGSVITGVGVLDNTYVTATTNSTTWTVNNSQTVASETLTQSVFPPGHGTCIKSDTSATALLTVAATTSTISGAAGVSGATVPINPGGEVCLLATVNNNYEAMGYLSGVPGAVAVMVQHESSSNTRYMAFVANGSGKYCYYYQAPNAVQAGNGGIISVQFGSNQTPTATDDAGNTYTIGENFYDTGDNQSIAILGAFNIVAGARLITICFPSNPGQNVQPMFTEFANVTGFDGAGVANNGSSTTASPGTLNPTQNGDLIYQVTASIGCPLHLQCQASYAAHPITNLPMSLLSADLLDGFSAQYGVYAAASSVSPTTGMGTNRAWVSAAVALKSGAAGSVPTGMRIVHLVHQSMVYNNAGFVGTGTPYPNPTNLQFPSSGNLLVAQIIDGACCVVTSVTDTATNAWQRLTDITGTCCWAQTYYVPNAASSSNLGVTLNWTASNGDPHMVLYDVAGAAASPLDTSNGASGDDTTSIDTNNAIATGYTVTPAQANEFIFSIANWDANVGVSLDGQNFLGNTFDGNLAVNGPALVDEQGGLGTIITPNTNPVSFTWRMVRGTAPSEQAFPGNWVSMSAAFKGP